MEQNPVIKDLEVSVESCQKLWVQDEQSATVDVRRYLRLNLFRGDNDL